MLNWRCQMNQSMLDTARQTQRLMLVIKDLNKNTTSLELLLQEFQYILTDGEMKYKMVEVSDETSSV